LSLKDDEFVMFGRDILLVFRGLAKPVEESVDHDVRQNWVGVVTLKEFEKIIAEIYLPSTTLRAWTSERVIVLTRLAQWLQEDQKGTIWN
jgi:hypothetical protein